jgi:hypothetical protein
MLLANNTTNYIIFVPMSSLSILGFLWVEHSTLSEKGNRLNLYTPKYASKCVTWLKPALS